MLAQLAKAAIYRPPLSARSSLILSQQVVSRPHQIKPAHFNSYHRLVDWPEALFGYVHPNYVQVLSLPMQLDMMTQFPFPFKALGLVHIGNKINVIKLPKSNASLDLNTYFGNVYAHKRGIVFELHSEACEDNAVAVKATSYYLARSSQERPLGLQTFKESMLVSSKRVHQVSGEKAKGKIEEKQQGYAEQRIEDSNQTTLDFEEFVGRKYAKVSGDYNPIHLWPTTSRLFGFDKAIAHGMYSHAKALSVIARMPQYNIENSHCISAVFKHAIELPNSSVLQVEKQPAPSALQFNLSSTTQVSDTLKTRQHLVGSISPL